LKGVITTSEIIENFKVGLIEDGKSPKTVESYVGDIKAFKEFLETKGVDFNGTLQRFYVVRYEKALDKSLAMLPGIWCSGTSYSATIQNGSKGNAVVELQKNLIKMGYDCGSCGADGDFGTGTNNAVKKFQSDYGLTQDGIAGPQTNQAIANALKTGSDGVPNYIMHKINSISTGKNIEWNNGVPKDIMNKINAGTTPNPDAISISCAFF